MSDESDSEEDDVEEAETGKTGNSRKSFVHDRIHTVVVTKAIREGYHSVF